MVKKYFNCIIYPLRIGILAALFFILLNYFFKHFYSGHWIDELYSLASSYGQWNKDYLIDLAKDGIPFGHYLLLKMVTFFFEEKAFVARLFSGTLFIGSMLFMAIREKLSWRSLLALALICLSPGLLYFSTEIRPYAAKIFFLFCSCYFFQNFLSLKDDTDKGKTLLFWGIFNFLGFSHHYTFLAVPASHILICYLQDQKFFKERLCRKEFIFPLIITVLPALQLLITDFSRFQATERDTKLFFKLDWLIIYYRPALNLFIWHFLSFLGYLTCGRFFYLLNHYHSKRRPPSWFALVGLTGVSCFFLSLIMLPIVDTLYPRYQMFFYLGLIFLFAHWVSHSSKAKALLGIGIALTLFTSTPFHNKADYLNERKFFKDVGAYLTKHSESEICMITSGDWTHRFYIPTLGKIYHQKIQSLLWHQKGQCKSQIKYNLFNNYEPLPGKVLFSSDHWSLALSES